MKDFFKFVFIVLISSFLNTTLHAQKNKKTDKKLWEYNDANEIDSVNLHSYYKVIKYVRGSCDSTKYINTFESNGLLYIQIFLAFPVYSRKESDQYLCYTKEDTLMMFLNEDFSYREVPTYKKDPYTTPKPCVYAWYGLVFEKTISVSSTPGEIEAAKLTFGKEVKNEITDVRRYRKIEYFQRIDSGYEYDCYIKAIHSESKKLSIIFIPKYEPFE